jgi:hypothetical protein
MKVIMMSDSRFKIIKGGEEKDSPKAEVPELDKRIEVASTALLKYWFPKRMPTDIEKWAEIAYNDALAVVKALKKEGYLK